MIELFKGAFGWIKDRIDPQTRSTIATAATLEIGNTIAATAEEKDNSGVSYLDIGRCTGLVITSYKTAGIDLKQMAKDAGYGDPSNVSSMYLFVKSKPEYWAGSGPPAVGDIAFFKETYERAESSKRQGDDNVTHVGIVTVVQNNKIATMVHAAGVKKGIVDVNFSSGIESNPYWNEHFVGFGRPR